MVETTLVFLAAILWNKSFCRFEWAYSRLSGLVFKISWKIVILIRRFFMKISKSTLMVVSRLIRTGRSFHSKKGQNKKNPTAGYLLTTLFQKKLKRLLFTHQQSDFFLRGIFLNQNIYRFGLNFSRKKILRLKFYDPSVSAPYIW